MAMANPNELRSKIMRSVKSKNTGAEIITRKMLHEMGFHYRLHVKKLPGTPDIVFSKRKKVIFVNGCFWHGHNCNKGRLPKSNLKFWTDKIHKNITRDLRNHQELNLMGWKFLIIWQCEIKVDPNGVRAKLLEFLAAE